MTTGSSTAAVPGAGNSNSLPGHQSARTKHNYVDQQIVNSSENVIREKTNLSFNHRSIKFVIFSLLVTR